MLLNSLSYLYPRLCCNICTESLPIRKLTPSPQACTTCTRLHICTDFIHQISCISTPGLFEKLEHQPLSSIFCNWYIIREECKTFRSSYHRLGRVFWLSCIYFYYQRAFSLSDCYKGSALLQWLFLHVRVRKTWHMQLQLASIIWVFKINCLYLRQWWQLTLYWNPINCGNPRAIWKKMHCTCFTSNTFSLSDRQWPVFVFFSSFCAGVI